MSEKDPTKLTQEAKDGAKADIMDGTTKEVDKAARLKILSEFIKDKKWRHAADQAQKMGKEGEAFFPEILVSCLDDFPAEAEKLADKMGEEGKKYLPRILKTYIKYITVCSDEAEKLADKMGEEGKKYLSKILLAYLNPKTKEEDLRDKKFAHVFGQFYLKHAELDQIARAEKLAEKMGEEGKQYFPAILDGYMTYIDAGMGYRNEIMIKKGQSHAEKLAEKMGKEAQLQVLEHYMKIEAFFPAEALARKIGQEGDSFLAKIFEGVVKGFDSPTTSRQVQELLERTSKKMGVLGQEKVFDVYMHQLSSLLNNINYPYFSMARERLGDDKEAFLINSISELAKKLGREREVYDLFVKAGHRDEAEDFAKKAGL